MEGDGAGGGGGGGVRGERCRQINLIKGSRAAPPWTALRSPRTEMSVCSHYVEFILPLLSKQPNIRLLKAQPC